MTHDDHRTRDTTSADSIAEQAALYLAGALTRQEREAFEAELLAGRAEHVREFKRLESVAAALAEGVSSVSPDPRVREALRKRISRDDASSAPTSVRAQIWRHWDADDDAEGFFTIRADEGAWEETGVDGVQVKRLFVDRGSNRMTALFRMDAGTSYPEHAHSGVEECFVLEGDLHADDFVMTAGDYQRARHGSHHGRQWTEGGCVLLVTCALDDEMV